MKKLALLATLVAAVAGIVAVSGAFASVPSPSFAAQSTGYSCGVYDFDGSIFITNQSSDTLYNSGKEQEHCWGQDASGGDGAYHVFSGFACGLVYSGVSVNPANKDTVSKTGASALTCFNDGYSAPASSASVGAR